MSHALRFIGALLAMALWIVTVCVVAYLCGASTTVLPFVAMVTIPATVAVAVFLRLLWEALA